MTGPTTPGVHTEAGALPPVPGSLPGPVPLVAPLPTALLPPALLPPPLVPLLPSLGGTEQLLVAWSQQVAPLQLRPGPHEFVESHGQPCVPSTQKPITLPFEPPLELVPPVLAPFAPEP
jgi:hypothetical protein